LLLLLTTPAFAEDDVPELELSFAPDVAGATAGVFADATTTGADTQELRAGAWIEGNAEWHYWRSYAFARGQAEASLRAGSDGAGLVFAQDAELRPVVLPAFQLTFAERLAFDVAPELGDRPDRWRRRYRSAGFDVDMIGLQWLGKHAGVQFMVVDNGFDFEEQQDGDATVHRFSTTADWSPFAFTRLAGDEQVGKLDLIALEATAIDGAYEGAVMTTFYPRLSDVQLGPLWFDAAYGHASTAYSQISVNDEVVSTIDSLDLPDLQTPAWRARLGVHSRVEASAGIERNLHLTADAALVLEERASADVATTFDEVAVSATAFAARSRIWTSPDDSIDHVTGGGGVAVSMPFRAIPGDGWHVTGAAEVARTFYATLESDRALRVDTALRFDLGLRRELRNWVPRAGTVIPAER